MKQFTIAALAASALAVLTAFAAPPASAHSMKKLKGDLAQREIFFQPLDKDAPDFTLEDAGGQRVGLTDFRGKVVVLHFVYASCPDVCPLHADRIAEIQEMINGTPMKDRVQFISITTDPKNDTPDVLRDYGPAHGLDSVNWSFLTIAPEQAEDATRRLAEEFGHKFTKAEGGYQVHSIVTHVIDGQGRWRANFHGLKFDPASLVLFVNGLLHQDHAPESPSERGVWDRLRGLF